MTRGTGDVVCLSTGMKQRPKVAKQRVFAACVALVVACAAFSPSPPTMVVVLDAGHGGKDPGNLGTGRYPLTEKDVTLEVTLKLGAYIEENLPEVKVVYTRKDDSYPGLRDRVKIANEAQADLFISIHCDAFADRSARGAGTYVMGMHKSEESLRVAMRENASMFKEEGYEAHYDGFDPNDPDTYIALSLRQNVNLDASLTLGAAIQSQFKNRVGRKDRGVKQAGFYVISYTTMPSTLVELGFLTNPDEEDFLQSEQGKSYMASGIYRAFRDTYLAGRTRSEVPEHEAPPPPTETSVSDKDIWFGIQILTTEAKLSPDSPELRGHSQAKAYIRHGLHKYVLGRHLHPDQAHSAKLALRAEGFEGAFVVAFDGETQIPMSRARDLLNLPLQ